MGKLKDIGFYFITDRKLTKNGNIEDVKAAIEAGVKVVQYREKDLSTKDMIKEAIAIRSICKDIIFLVNDGVDVCLAVNADGVHLGNGDMPFEVARKLLNGKIIGLSCRSLDDALKAEKAGADYISLGPIFKTETKRDLMPVGPELIEEVKKRVKLPIIAIGGINKENIALVIKAGADGAAMISAIVTKDDVEKEVKECIGIINDSA